MLTTYKRESGISNLTFRETATYIMSYKGHSFSYVHDDAISLYNKINKTNFNAFSDEDEMKDFVNNDEVKYILYKNHIKWVKKFFGFTKRKAKRKIGIKPFVPKGIIIDLSDLK